MSDFVESLSFGSVTALVAAVAAIVTFITGFFWRGKLAWLLVPFVPFVIAYCLYWFPAWSDGRDTSEYSTWAPVFIGPWFLAGMGASLIAFWLTRILHKRKAKRSS